MSGPRPPQPLVYTRWLTPADARAVARLERAVHPRGSRAGLREIRFDLKRACGDGSNLSAGLFDRGRLVGCTLAFARQDRRLAFQEFEVALPESGAPTGPGIYLEDLMLRPAYRRHTYTFFRRWLWTLRRTYPGWPLDAFCRPQLLLHWQRHARAVRRIGLASASTLKVTDLTAGEDWYWLSWDDAGMPPQRAPPDVGAPGSRINGVRLPAGFEARLIDTEGGWLRLRDDWTRLAAAVPEPGPFASFELNLLWWQHFGLPRQLLIVVLYRHGRAVGIAPLSVAPERRLGGHLASLQFIGDHSLMERPGLLADPEVPQAQELLWRCALALRPCWNAALLHEQAATRHDHPLVLAAGDGEFVVRETPPQTAALVACGHPWENYLAGRSRALRRNYGRRLRKLQQAGTLELLERGDEADGAANLQRYLDVERRSWKHAAGQGLEAKPGHLAYYRDLCAAEASHGRIRFRFLTLDGRDIAATFGLVHHGHYVSLEICHDAAFDGYSPGLVLTGLELQRCHGSDDCAVYDFLSGTPNNKETWATETRITRDIYLLPRNLHGRATAFTLFHFKPAIKRLLGAIGLRGVAVRAFERLRRRS